MTATGPSARSTTSSPGPNPVATTAAKPAIRSPRRRFATATTRRCPESELFHRGYIALRSGHTRGSTVDLTLIPLSRAADAGAAFQEPDDCRFGNGTPFAADGSLEMGTAFDCFDERAHADNPEIAPLARHNRQLLRQAMLRRGFAPYAKEWWHFTLTAEPFSERSFDFEVR